MSEHPLDELLKWFPEHDFALLSHGFAQHGRDYFLVTQFGGVKNPGTYELSFTHCVRAYVRTNVGDAAWPMSWSDELTDYDRWLAAGEPDGYVWGTNWSLAFPGLVAVRESKEAADWARRVGHEMYEATLESDRVFLSLVFHSIRSRRLNDDSSTVDHVIIPNPPPDIG